MSDRAELLKLHDWDELLFGGFYCLHCTPDDEDNFDDPIAWPCQPLRDAGLTDDEAREIIVAHRAEYRAKKAAEQAEEQRQVNEFNHRYPVGTLVFAYPGFRPEDDATARRLVTRTRTEAQLSASGDPVVWVEGEGSYISLTHVDPVAEDVWEAARKTLTAARVEPLRQTNAAYRASEEILQQQIDQQAKVLDHLRAELDAFRALELGDLDGRVSATCADPGHPTWLRAKDDTRGCPWCRVAALEAERHTTNEALSDAAEQLRVNRDRIAELEAQLYTEQAHSRTFLEQRNAHAQELLKLRPRVAELQRQTVEALSTYAPADTCTCPPEETR